ncbi:MAG: ABC transporter permease [Actinobacteria bacterium]|nr:ABC transporter permease [Actinomycetota bacterium]
MLGYISKRVAQMALLFVVFLTLLFLLLQAQPGDFASQFLDPRIPAANQELIRQRLGLDQGMWGQYWTYITNFFTGDLGTSFMRYPKTVWAVIVERIPRTMFLFTMATMLSYWMGFLSGKMLAWRRGGKLEYGITLGGVFLYTVFYPWFALMMIWLWAATLEIVPINQFLTPDFWLDSPFSATSVFTAMIWSSVLVVGGLLVVQTVAGRMKEYRTQVLLRRTGRVLVFGIFVWYWASSSMRPFAADITHHAVLPVVTLAFIAFAGVMLITRGSMLETLREDYILTARAKGVPDRIIRDKHAARNALLPVVTSFILGLAFIIGGGLVTETVFSWPGMGELLLTAVTSNDIPTAIGTLALIGALALIAHIVVDIVYLFLDPRIRVQG